MGVYLECCGRSQYALKCYFCTLLTPRFLQYVEHVFSLQCAACLLFMHAGTAFATVAPPVTEPTSSVIISVPGTVDIGGECLQQ